MESTYEDTLTGFDLSLLSETPPISVVSTKADRQRTAIALVKKRLIATDILINKFYSKNDTLELTEKLLNASKDKCKEKCIEYQNALEKVSDLESHLQALENRNREFQELYNLSECRYKALESHTNQLQVLVKEHETVIEGLKLENKLEKSNYKDNDNDTQILSLRKQNQELKNHIWLAKKVLFGERKFSKQLKHWFQKNVTSSDIDGTIESENDDDFIDDVSSPVCHNDEFDEESEIKASGILDNNINLVAGNNDNLDNGVVTNKEIDNDSDCSHELVSLDTGRGSSLALSETEKYIQSPDFSDTGSPINDEIDKTKENAVTNKAFEHFQDNAQTYKLMKPSVIMSQDDKPTRSDIATSPIIFESDINMSETIQYNNEKENLEKNYTNNDNYDDNIDCEVQNILKSIRLENIILPMPTTPSKLVKNNQTEEFNGFVCQDSLKVLEKTNILHSKIADLAKDIKDIKTTTLHSPNVDLAKDIKDIKSMLSKMFFSAQSKPLFENNSAVNYITPQAESMTEENRVINEVVEIGTTVERIRSNSIHNDNGEVSVYEELDSPISNSMPKEDSLPEPKRNSIDISNNTHSEYFNIPTIAESDYDIEFSGDDISSPDINPISIGSDKSERVDTETCSSKLISNKTPPKCKSSLTIDDCNIPTNSVKVNNIENGTNEISVSKMNQRLKNEYIYNINNVDFDTSKESDCNELTSDVLKSKKYNKITKNRKQISNEPRSECPSPEISSKVSSIESDQDEISISKIKQQHQNEYISRRNGDFETSKDLHYDVDGIRSKKLGKIGKSRKLTKLDKLKKKLVPKTKIRCPTPPPRKLKNKFKPIKNATNTEPNTTKMLNNQAAYENAVKFMAEFNSKNISLTESPKKYRKSNRVLRNSLSQKHVHDPEEKNLDKSINKKRKSSTTDEAILQSVQKNNIENKQDHVTSTEHIVKGLKPTFICDESDYNNCNLSTRNENGININEVHTESNCEQLTAKSPPKRLRKLSMTTRSVSKDELNVNTNCNSDQDSFSNSKTDQRKGLKRPSTDTCYVESNKRRLRSSSIKLSIDEEAEKPKAKKSNNNSDDTNNNEFVKYKQLQSPPNHKANERYINNRSYGDIDMFAEHISESHVNTKLSNSDVNTPNIRETNNLCKSMESRAVNKSILCTMIEKYSNCSHKQVKKVTDTAASNFSKKIEKGITNIAQLSSKEAKEALNEFVTLIESWNMRHFIAGLMKYLKDPERKTEFYKKVNAPPAPQLTKSEEILLYVVAQLKNTIPDIDSKILNSIEYTLFQLHQTPEFDVIETMSHFYAVCCRYFGSKSRLRLFMLDAMYCLQYKAIPLIKQCLEVWIHILPLAHMGIAKSPLVTCLVYVLYFYKCEDKFHRVQDIRNILCRKYSYQISDWNETKILESFKYAILDLKDNSLEKKMLKLAIIILAKRQGPRWCLNNLIKNLLVPLIENVKVKAKVKQFCVSLLGALLKPFPKDMKVHSEIYTNKLVDMLDCNPSPDMQEAIFTSLLYLNRQHQNKVIKAMLSWKPKQISEELEVILEDFVKEKSLKTWKNVLTRLSNNIAID